MTLPTIYEKDNKRIIVHNKFIYCDSIYMIWKNGASLLEEKYYSSDKPISINKKNLKKKMKGYNLFRFFELEYAPESYLCKEGYKLIKV